MSHRWLDNLLYLITLSLDKYKIMPNAGKERWMCKRLCPVPTKTESLKFQMQKHGISCFSLKLVLEEVYMEQTFCLSKILPVYSLYLLFLLRTFYQTRYTFTAQSVSWVLNTKWKDPDLHESRGTQRTVTPQNAFESPAQHTWLTPTWSNQGQ